MSVTFAPDGDYQAPVACNFSNSNAYAVLVAVGARFEEDLVGEFDAADLIGLIDQVKPNFPCEGDMARRLMFLRRCAAAATTVHYS